MHESNFIKQNETDITYKDLLLIYEHYIYEVPSLEGYKLTEEDMSNLIKHYTPKFNYDSPLGLEARLYHDIRTIQEVLDSI
ncbi:hypothetical protein EYB35_07310 [Bacillus paranthracis]|nr:hypothetical protein EYB35_07310 [Bacillus paranthracis]